LTHLSVEAFAGVHYGHLGGEFRLQLPPGLVNQLSAFCAASANLGNYPVLDLGAALRIKL